MIFCIKQKAFSFGDKFTVYDHQGRELYYVKGEVFSFGKKLHLYDLNQTEIAFIQQKVFSFLPKYHVIMDGIKAAEVVKSFTFFRSEYTVPNLGWKVYGDFFDHEYQIYDGARQIAAVSKQWYTWGDTYHIETDSDYNSLLLLAICLVVDACLESNSN